MHFGWCQTNRLLVFALYLVVGVHSFPGLLSWSIRNDEEIPLPRTAHSNRGILHSDIILNQQKQQVFHHPLLPHGSTNSMTVVPSYKTVSLGTLQMVQGRMSLSPRIVHSLLYWRDNLSGNSMAGAISLGHGINTEAAAVIVRKIASGIQSALSDWWWTFPMILAVWPAYRWFCLSVPTVTPNWWKMTCMQYIRKSPDQFAVVSLFLLSNASYFLTSACFFGLSSKWAMPYQNKKIQFTDLGYGVLACGFVSTVFHSLQAHATNLISEAACFVDHGVALTCFLYFCRVCGLPRQKRVLVTGGIGLLALALPLQPAYTWLHSAWHVLSALAALLWGLQKKQVQQ